MVTMAESRLARVIMSIPLRMARIAPRPLYRIRGKRVTAEGPRLPAGKERIIHPLSGPGMVAAAVAEAAGGPDGGRASARWPAAEPAKARSTAHRAEP